LCAQLVSSPSRSFLKTPEQRRKNSINKRRSKKSRAKTRNTGKEKVVLFRETPLAQKPGEERENLKLFLSDSKSRFDEEVRGVIFFDFCWWIVLYFLPFFSEFRA
jgi:hypothetical protein